MATPKFNEEAGVKGASGYGDFTPPENPKVDPGYVMRLRDELKMDYRGFQTKITELENIRYLEGQVSLPAAERPTGLEIRTGMSADLIEKVKAALTTNMPKVQVNNLREGGAAADNAAKRQNFWNEFLKSITRPIPTISEIVDSQAGLGMGIPKLIYYPWTGMPERGKQESDKDYVDRARVRKRQLGPPFKVISVHPLAWLPRMGAGNQVDESIEESLKNKNRIFATYGLSEGEKGDKELQSLRVAAVEGQATVDVRALPSGQSTTGLVKVTEYNAPGICRQVYIEDRLVYEEEGSSVAYFPCLGRTSSSKDPDKTGMSVADVLRHIEPIVDRTLTRMAEASDMVVKKRLAAELPEGSTEYLDPDKPGADNNPEPRSFTFDPEVMRALPPGVQIRDPFEGAENVYGAMPFIQLLMSIASEHGVSPIFKGVSPGAGGSGYRDNSLYLMARSQFMYLLENLQFSIERIIETMEIWVVTKVKREVVCGPYSLTPKDIEEWPATYSVSIEPFLPQNIMAEAAMYDNMWTKGHVTRRTVRTDGLKLAEPEKEGRERLLEDLQDLMKPVLMQDVLRSTGIIKPEPTEPTKPQLVDGSGNPIGGQNEQIGAGAEGDQGGAGRSAGGPGSQQSLAATSQQGSPKDTGIIPGSLNGA